MIGQTLSHFKITAKLGEGGMGEVYEAWDETLERPVALKILPPEMVQNADRVRRFVQEAKSASALNHPHIVTIYEIGQEAPEGSTETGEANEAGGGGAVHFIAMERIDGHTLKSRIHQDQAPSKDLLRWLGQAAEGLAKAHSEGIVHRDLKPDNIMVTTDGYAKVLDFGLAKLTEPLTEGTTRAPTIIADETAEGAVLGTVGYMSPEQVQGKQLDHRTDIFSFGCVLYEAMTRQRPFAGETAVDTMHQILRSRPAPVRELSPETPAAVRRMIRRCLAKDPDRRFQSMKDLALELSDLVEEWDELSLRADSSTWGESGSLPPIADSPFNWKAMAISVAGVTLLLAGALLVWRPWQGTSEQLSGGSPVSTSFSQVTQQPGSESNGDLSSDGRFVTYVSDAMGSDDIYLLRVGGRNPVNLTADSGAENRSPMFSPDGEFLVFRSSRDGGGLFIMGATGESVRRLTDHGHDAAWSPDGQRIAFVHEGTFDPAGRTEESALWIVDSAGGEPQQIFAGDAMRPRWSPTGSRIVFWAIKDMALGSAQRDIASISAAGGEPVWLTDDEHLDWSPVWSPDGQWVYFLSDRGGSRNLWRIAVEESTGEAQSAPQPITVPSRSIDSLSISGDGTRILYTDLDRSANIVKAPVGPDWAEPAGAPVPVTGGSARYEDPQVSPDAQWVAFRNAGKQEDIYVVRSDGSDLRQLTDDAFRDRRPAWFPDGRTLVFYSNRTGRYEFWSISLDGSDLKQLTESTGDSFFYPRISPDGTMLVATNEFTSAIWDLAGALPATESSALPPIDAAGHSLFDPRWSRDGRSLVGFVFPEAGQGPFEALALYSLERSEYEVFTLESLLDGGVLFWDREGRRIFFATVGDSTESILHSLDPSSGEIRQLWPLAENTGGYDLAPSGDWLVFTQYSGEADLWLATLETP